MNTVAEVKRKARILLMFSVRRTQEKEAAPYIWKIVLYIQQRCHNNKHQYHRLYIDLSD